MAFLYGKMDFFMQTFHAYPFLNTEWDSVSLQIWENAVFTGDSSWYYPHMTSPFNRLYFIMEGEIYLENEKGRNLLRSGHMYLVPAGSCYTYGCTNKVRKFYVHFNTELLPGIDLFGELDTILSIPFEKPLLDKIFAEMKKESLSGLLHLKAIFWQIICDFFESSSPDTCQYLHKFRGYYRQREAITYISENLQAGLRIQEIANALHTTTHILSRTFRQDTGLGLKEYMEQMLMQKARLLLLYTNRHINKISEELGFSDPFYFSRFFKKREKLSPREYRLQRVAGKMKP